MLFPAEHWMRLRMSKPIENVFATARRCKVRLNGEHSWDTARLMVFKLVMTAAKSWRGLQGRNQLPKVFNSVTFHDDIEVAPEAKAAA